MSEKEKTLLSGEVIQRVINMRIEQGFIDEDLMPLKCRLCNSKSLESFDHYQEGNGLIEYSIKCSDCGAILGHWAYGDWNIEYVF